MGQTIVIRRGVTDLPDEAVEADTPQIADHCETTISINTQNADRLLN